VIAYVESSAAVKLLRTEDETVALQAYLDERRARGDQLVSSLLLETELRRAAIRQGAPQAAATALLNRFDLYEIARADFTSAGFMPGVVRSLDALHVASALALGADVVVTYDARQREAAEAVGLPTVAPN